MEQTKIKAVLHKAKIFNTNISHAYPFSCFIIPFLRFWLSPLPRFSQNSEFNIFNITSSEESKFFQCVH